jgi:hypothetical protein
MALDLAIGKNGDLLIAANRDIEIRTGQPAVDQRIRVRLMIYGGEWELQPIWRAQEEVPQMVMEALEPMDDISVRDVTCDVDPDNSRGLDIVVYYSMVDDGVASEEILTTTLTIEG